MSIYNNINGVYKTVNNTKVNIDGTWRGVSSSSNNIGGIWKSNKAYHVYIYRNGQLYQTLECAPGKSVTLPSLDSGYTNDINGTTITYNNGTQINLTRDIKVYSLKAISPNKLVQCSYPNTITINIATTQTITISGMSTANSTVYLHNYSYASYVKINGEYFTYTFTSCNNVYRSTTKLVYPGTIEVHSGDSWENIRINYTYTTYSTKW